MSEPGAWSELEAAVGAAVWAYAEAVTGRTRAEAEAGWPPLAARQLHLARLAAARLLRGTAEAAERDAVTSALAEDVTYAALGEAAGMSRQAATRRYKPSPPGAPAAPG
jgi:hypothetical protein